MEENCFVILSFSSFDVSPNIDEWNCDLNPYIVLVLQQNPFANDDPKYEDEREMVREIETTSPYFVSTSLHISRIERDKHPPYIKSV